MKVQSFLNSVEGYVNAGPQSSADKPNRIAVIDSAYSGSGNPLVTFEGESVQSSKGYTALAAYKPVASDRVLMVPVGTGYMIAGKIPSSVVGPDTFHIVGAAGEPAFQNSWVNFVSTFQVARFTKDALGYTVVSGLVKLGTLGNPIFNLPAAYRSLADLRFAGSCASGSTTMTVGANGDIFVAAYQAGGTNANVSLDGIRFAAGF